MRDIDPATVGNNIPLADETRHGLDRARNTTDCPGAAKIKCIRIWAALCVCVTDASQMRLTPTMPRATLDPTWKRSIEFDRVSSRYNFRPKMMLMILREIGSSAREKEAARTVRYQCSVDF